MTLVSLGRAADKPAADKTEQSAAPSKESFNLIIPFKDLTVGQGQEVTMDTEIVNRRRDPVEVSLEFSGHLKKGRDRGFKAYQPVSGAQHRFGADAQIHR
jgi:hypothetical protein